MIALASILNVVAGVPFPIGCTIGGAVITVAHRGWTLTAAWINVIQLSVKLGGFAVALPLVLYGAGGWDALTSVRPDDEAYWSFTRPGPPGVMMLVSFGPAFIISPGLLQKIFGARDDRAVRLGVGANALGLFLYAGVPVLLGMAAQVLFPASPISSSCCRRF